MAESWPRRALFALEPERAHACMLAGVRWAHGLGLLRAGHRQPADAGCTVMGLAFPNRIGLAAGLDKNADAARGLAALGFGFVEVGTVTPRPQAGNPRPRVFRLAHDEAIINRLGFNNKGVDHLVRRLHRAPPAGVVGVNIGKNRETPPEKALADYCTCLQAVYDCCSYVTVNLSSPNTPGLRALQHGSQLDKLLDGVTRERNRLAESRQRYVPLVVKIDPDMDAQQRAAVLDALLYYRIDGVAATNTTVSRPANLADNAVAEETGGLSGRPLEPLSTDVVKAVSAHVDGRMAVIGIGGVMDPDDARAKREAGADLVQLYTGLVYRGPGVVPKLARSLAGT